MPKELQQLIAQILEKSHCSPEEKLEMERELSSHILESIREMELQGKSEEKIIEQITQEFGDPNTLAQQFFIVHKRFENLPLIGPLLYYVPVRMGLRLLLTHLIIYLVFAAFFLMVLWRVFDQSAELAQRIEQLSFVSFGLLSMLQGWMVSQKVMTLMTFIETLVTSLVPLACLIIFLVLIIGLAEDSELTNMFRLLAWPLGVQIGGLSLGWAISAFIKTHRNEQSKPS